MNVVRGLPEYTNESVLFAIFTVESGPHYSELARRTHDVVADGFLS